MAEMLESVSPLIQMCLGRRMKMCIYTIVIAIPVSLSRLALAVLLLSSISEFALSGFLLPFGDCVSGRYLEIVKKVSCSTPVKVTF